MYHKHVVETDIDVMDESVESGLQNDDIPSFVKDIEIYDVTENQVFLKIYGQIYVYEYLTEANNVIEERY